MGGASGTWTLSFLRAVPAATATIFDLPDAVEQARQRLAGTEFERRVTLVAGDFYLDQLPAGADFAWVSAICHQHSRRHNRELFTRISRSPPRPHRDSRYGDGAGPCASRRRGPVRHQYVGQYR